VCEAVSCVAPRFGVGQDLGQRPPGTVDVAPAEDAGAREHEPSRQGGPSGELAARGASRAWAAATDRPLWILLVRAKDAPTNAHIFGHILPRNGSLQLVRGRGGSDGAKVDGCRGAGVRFSRISRLKGTTKHDVTYLLVLVSVYVCS